MKKRKEKKCVILGTLFILMTMSILPVHASEIKNEVLPQTIHENGENILGTITIEWQSFFATGKLTDLIPIINFTQSDTRIFYFSEINGVLQMNFTVICRQILLNRTLFPRYVRYEFMLPQGGPYIYNKVRPSFCWSLSWKYSNITVGPNTLNDLVTNGSNAILKFKLGVRPFPPPSLFLTGKYFESEPITLVPIPKPP
jgi:hypothetical protein